MSNRGFIGLLAAITIVNAGMMVTAPHPIIYIMGGFGAALGVGFLIAFIWILNRGYGDRCHTISIAVYG